jgi:hypothetical protein
MNTPIRCSPDWNCGSLRRFPAGQLVAWCVRCYLNGKRIAVPVGNAAITPKVAEMALAGARDRTAGGARVCDKIGLPFGPLFQLLLLTGQRRDEVAA